MDNIKKKIKIIKKNIEDKIINFIYLIKLAMPYDKLTFMYNSE